MGDRHIRFSFGYMFLAAAAVTGSTAVNGCSLLNTTAVQCLSQAECLAKGPAFANTTCDPGTRTCVPVDAGLGNCQHNSDCIAANGNAAAICRPSDHTCQVLKTAECPDLLGTMDQVKNDNVIVLGLISTSGSNVGGAQVESAVSLAQSDFTMAVPGLPSYNGSGPRPVVFVACQELSGGVPGAVRAAQHLTNDLQVPIVVGGYVPADINQILTEALLPTGTMLVTIFGFDSLEKLGPNPAAPTPLVWRTETSDSVFAPTVQGFLHDQLEPNLVNIGAKAQASDPTRVLLFQEKSVLGATEGSKIQQVLAFNGQPAVQQDSGTFQSLNFGDPISDPVSDPDPVATAESVFPPVFTLAPHVVIWATVTPWAVPFVMQPLESQWDNGTAANGSGPAPRPLHVTISPSWATVLPGAFAKDPSLPDRIFQLSPVYPGADPTLLSTFVQRFNNANKTLPPLTTVQTNAHLAYDMAYMAEFVLAQIGNAPLTGVNAANAAVKLTIGGGQVYTADPSNIESVLGLLSSGMPVTISGLTGPFIFDSKTAVRALPMSVGCTTPGGAPKPTGYVFDSTTMKGTGSWDMTKCPPAP